MKSIKVKQRESLILAIGGTVFSLAIVIIGMKLELFGARIPGLQRFCEIERAGFIKQPANTFSNFAFIIFGIVLAIQNYFGKFSKNHNLIQTNTVYTNIFSLGLILTGAGSFAFHGNYAFWGSFMDLFGMFFLASFMLTYALMRLLKLSKLQFGIVFLVALTVSSLAKIYLDNNIPVLGPLKVGEIIFGSYLLVGLIIELYFSFLKSVSLNKLFIFLAIGITAFSFVIWNLSYGPGSLLCNPSSLLQGHALWHILDAVAAFFLFQYYVSENNLINRFRTF